MGKQNTTVGCAVGGLGIGMAHVAGYLASEDARLVSVADAWDARRVRVGGTFEQGSMLNLRPLFDERVLADTWQELGVRVCEDVREIVADDEVELVSLCTPDDTHEEYAVALLDAGKHLLLEKPVALTLKSAARIGEAARRNGCRLAVGYEMRINPVVQKVRELVESGALGEIHAFTLQQFRKPFRRDKWQRWIQSKKRSGGLLVEETCHWFDLARYITGKEVARVHCVGTDRILPDFDYEDIAFVQGWYDDGSVFQIGHSLTGFDFSLVIQAHGTAGTAWCGLKGEPRSLLDAGQTDYIGVVSWGPVDGGDGVQSVTFGNEAREGENIRDQVQHVVHALAGESGFPAEFDDGVAALAVALAARRSLESEEVEEVYGR